MLRWIFSLSALCVVSAAMGFGKIVPLASSLEGLCLAVSALSATLLIGSFEAYETQGPRFDAEDA